MFGSKSSDRVAPLLAQLARRHRKLLKEGEVFLAACDAFGAAEPHPAPLNSRRKRQALDASTSEERLQRSAAARFRFTKVLAALGMHEDDFSEMPRSSNGFMLTHTDRRVLIFDGFGQEFQLQAPMKGLWLQPVDHGDDVFTLVFNNGDERVALATRRESVHLATSFIESFPDRRQQTRVLSVTNDPDIIEF